MQKYACIKPLDLEKFDEDGRSVEGEMMTVEAGTGWYIDESTDYHLVAGSDAYRLIQITNSNHGAWIEIYGDTLGELFMKID